MFSTDYRSRVVGHRPTVINFTTGSTVVGRPPGHPPHRGTRPHKPLWERPKPGRLGGPIGGGVRNVDESRRARDQARERQRAADEKARRDRDERERKARQRKDEEARQRRIDEMGRQARKSQEEKRRREEERRAAEQRRAAERRRAEQQELARQQREREAAARRGAGGWLRDRVAELLPAAASIASTLTTDAAVFRWVISPAFERIRAPATLVLPDEFRASAVYVEQASLANAVKHPPATGAPPTLPEVNRGIVIENGVLKAIPGNIGQASTATPSVPPVYASPGQEFIARIHVHPGRTPLDADDIAYLWEPGAPRMTGAVVGGELGVMIRTRESEQIRVNYPFPFALGNVTHKFQKVIDSVEKPALARLKSPTATQKNEARHAALAVLARQFGFVYYRGALGTPLRRFDAAKR